MNSSSDTLTPQKRTIPENIANIKESVGEIAQTERQRAGELLAQGKERVRGVQHAFEDHVRERPIRSLLIASGIGVALGFLLRGRR